MAGVLRGFIDWLRSYGFASHDPQDFWTTRLGRRAKRLYYRRRALGGLTAGPFVALDLVAPWTRAWFASMRRYPVADAHFAMGFFMLAKHSRDSELLLLGRDCLDSLEASRAPGWANLGWGFPFDWEARSGLFPANTPFITMTPYGYEALEAAHEVGSDASYLQAMESVATFCFEDIGETAVGVDIAAASYSPHDRRQVVNASAYRAFLLTTAGSRFDRVEWVEAAKRNTAFVLTSQSADGSWPYSRDGTDRFVDHIHTCFVLKNLLKVQLLRPSRSLEDAIQRGLRFYAAQLIDRDGQPLPFVRSDHPAVIRQELYDYAEAINLALLADDVLGPAGREVAVDLMVARLLTVWLQRDGHFVSRRIVIGWDRVPYHRWGQSQIFRSLVLYLQRAG